MNRSTRGEDNGQQGEKVVLYKVVMRVPLRLYVADT